MQARYFSFTSAAPLIGLRNVHRNDSACKRNYFAVAVRIVSISHGAIGQNTYHWHMCAARQRTNKGNATRPSALQSRWSTEHLQYDMPKWLLTMLSPSHTSVFTVEFPE